MAEAQSDLKIKGIKAYFVRWLTLSSAVTNRFKGKIDTENVAKCKLLARLKGLSY